MSIRPALLALILVFGGAHRAAAQNGNGGFRLAAAAGPTINDLETGGIDWIFVGGVELRSDAWPLIVTGEIRYLTIELAEREHFVMPEVGLQFYAALGWFKPFVGVGGGWQFVVGPDDHGSSFAGHLATGFRIGVSSGVDLRFEVRGRSIDPAIAITGGLAIGL